MRQMIVAQGDAKAAERLHVTIHRINLILRQLVRHDLVALAGQQGVVQLERIDWHAVDFVGRIVFSTGTGIF
ncbi:MAG: hypothetical protein CME28_00635 [Gemmatimonadetes bacterium]|nr:hypothetical protein [Gemmatimonadota bacterium]